jgi:hypothetical protein
LPLRSGQILQAFAQGLLSHAGVEDLALEFVDLSVLGAQRRAGDEE